MPLSQEDLAGGPDLHHACYEHRARLRKRSEFTAHRSRKAEAAEGWPAERNAYAYQAEPAIDSHESLDPNGTQYVPVWRRSHFQPSDRRIVTLYLRNPASNPAALNRVMPSRPT